MRGSRCGLGLAAVVLLVACGGRGPTPTEAPPGPVREHWQLSHRVPASPGVRILGQRMDAYSESTRVGFARGREGSDEACTVTVSAPGWGGPENKVGEQLPATVQGRPALRNGAGAEGDYLMWQRPDGAWTESICDDEGQRASQDRLAELVTTQASTVRLPFDVVALPRGLHVSSIEQETPTGATTVRVAGTAEDVDQTETELVLTYDVELNRQEGRATTIAGHSASVDETPRFPGLCLAVQGHDVCIGVDSSDTGPYPDRSAELPVMVALAEGLRFPEAFGDRSDWFAAQDVFG